MQIEIKEVVANYVLDLFGQTVQARITRSIDESGEFFWDISHHRRGLSRAEAPSIIPVSSRKEALSQIIAYAKGFESGYTPRPNSSY